MATANLKRKPSHILSTRAKPTPWPTQNNTKNKNPKILSMCQYGCLSIMIMQKIVTQNQNHCGTSLLQGKRRSWSRLCGSLWFVSAGVERASREGSSYIYTSSTLTSRWHQRGQALWRTTGPPINLATFLFSILDSKRRLGTFKVFFGLILLILFSFLMALFFDWKVVRVLMVVGLSSPLSKSSFILFYSWCFCTPKAR